MGGANVFSLISWQVCVMKKHRNGHIGISVMNIRGGKLCEMKKFESIYGQEKKVSETHDFFNFIATYVMSIIVCFSLIISEFFNIAKYL